jgi:hypothetical protein
MHAQTSGHRSRARDVLDDSANYLDIDTIL